MARRRRRTYPAGEAARRRHGWLELVDTAGPFLTLPVVDRVWPNGLPEVGREARARVRSAVADALESGGATRHQAVRTVLDDALDWGVHLRWGNELPASLAEPVAEYGAVLTPDLAFYADPPAAEPTISEDDDDEEGDAEAPAAAPTSPWQLLGMLSAWGTHPLARSTTGSWAASPVERLAVLLRARSVPVGIVTDGRWWAVVWAPAGGTTGAAVWDASLWSEEVESFAAFVALLQRARFLAVAATDTLPALLVESQEAQEEVTETLGRQVRDAVELLLETFDRLDDESGVLAGVTDDDLYDGVVTVMMRVVFLLFAEERRLLPSDDDVYVSSYSVGRLGEQLERTEIGVLTHRTGAWHRLLATSRALHAGVAHEDLRLPAYGGGLFDPDRFPWLERRPDEPGVAARPPAVDDATVLRLLQAVQYVQVGGERRRLTFRALDVEQIGYVYEGLLELEVRTAEEVTLCLVRPPEWPTSKEPSELPLSLAEQWLADVPPRLAPRLKARIGGTESKIERALIRALAAHELDALRRHVGPDLAERLLPLAPVLRWDSIGRPAIALPGRRYVAPSSRRASTGAHYTPRSLAEDVAGNALEPLCYRPGPLETTDRATWRIRPSSELLDLRVADIAMGSGAFLVAACRYLADRLVEAWQAEGRPAALLAVRHARDGALAGDAEVDQVSLDARRVVAEHCLYGVDVNPLAVEMAKLSLWLVTMDRERPFGFLDDRLVAGDSLLGLTSVAQLEHLHLDPDSAPVAGLDITLRTDALGEAADLRRRITAQAVSEGRDVAFKRSLLDQATGLAAQLHAVADAVVGVGLRAGKVKGAKLDAAFAALAATVFSVAPDYVSGLSSQVEAVQAGRPAGVVPRAPLHWPLVFPEVFADCTDRGFDAIIGNPPFVGGQDISGALGGDYLAFMQRWDGSGVKGSADLAARFLLRAERLLGRRGQLGLLATNTLVQGKTLEVGLTQVVARGLTIRRGRSSHRWPTDSASLEIVDVWASRTPVAPGGVRWLDGEQVPAIGSDLEPVGRVGGRPQRLPENDGLAFIGSYVLGLGFTMAQAQAHELIARDPRNAEVLQPYVIGQDLNQRPDCSASRWIINFRDWPLSRAEEYPEVLDVVRRLVKPDRDNNKRPQRRDRWWMYAERAPELYRVIAHLNYGMAICLHSSAVVPVRLELGSVYSHGSAVFALPDFGSLALMSSSPATTWAWIRR